MSTRGATSVVEEHGGEEAFRRRAVALSVATAVSAVFAVISYGPLDFASVDGALAGLLIILGAVGVLAGLVHRPALLLGIGGLLLLLAALRLITYGHGLGSLGSSSTASLFAGLGLGHLGIAFAHRGG